MIAYNQNMRKINLPFSVFIWFCALIVIFNSCKNEGIKNSFAYDAISIHNAHQNLTDCIVEDLLTPPFASRVYAYCHVAMYEALRPAYPQYKELKGVLNGFDSIPICDTSKSINYELAAVTAFNNVAQKLVWSEHIIEAWQTKYVDSLKKCGLNEEVIQNSIEWARQVSGAILKWAMNDNFKATRKMMRYSLADTAGAWQLTPPAYAQPIEPYWGLIRPFLIDSPQQFSQHIPVSFNNATNSNYYKAVLEVYDISQKLTPEQINIAVFWDDNPNVAHLNGHAAYFAQKMTPGGHWLAITGAILKSRNTNAMQTSQTYTYASLVLADAFITCWHYKYKFNTVRPITVINEMKDPKWFSYIQTPPFPEYPSGHSTISGAVSTLLSKWLGDSIAFTDSSELVYNLPVRSFKSFNDAASEASVSRVYGGIHYRFTCDSSLFLGREIGNYYIEKLGINK
jgi:hypothetical protein